MKIGFLITARLKSSRLPLKAILMLKNRPIIDWVIERAKRVQYVDQIILCTSDYPQDKPLVDRAKDLGIYYFMGEPDDVLFRLYKAATFYQLDYIISVTADNPFFSIEYTHRIINEALKEKPDFIKITGLPIGCFTYGLSYHALKKVCDSKQVVDTEIWGPFFENEQIFSVKEIQAETRDQFHARLTIDTPEDFEFITKLADSLKENEWYSYTSIINSLKNNSEIIKINNHIQQKTLSVEEKRKMLDPFRGGEKNGD
ncbi:cytidylyltransferase domain-containing protein [Metabacillus elymi]|uniref:3-deoxy-manno-octulosonate cytidylyltransferase n=1 Tax=Metabacillus elymi TaxID=2745198 RepID=A0ABX6S323_9BACI|nr:3-deoxy-manno-octulosonate cytidylyltransferase [Metabacillus sp. KUDC1714]QNF28485.1 3-deoxy-manno-octulosonate cytidylyltransferase [Metabacillus sp. KUDC1714]